MRTSEENGVTNEAIVLQ